MTSDWITEEGNKPWRNSPWVPFWRAAQRLGVSESTLYRWIKADPSIRTMKLQRERFVHEGDIEIILTVRRSEDPDARIRRDES